MTGAFGGLQASGDIDAEVSPPNMASCAASEVIHAAVHSF